MPPTIITIFGITGDLASRKLIPALWRLSEEKLLPAQIRFVGFSRRELSDADVQGIVRDALLKKFPKISDSALSDFVKKFSYVQGQFDTPASYTNLAEFLQKIDDTHFKVCSNKLFYLAIPPHLYATVAEQLAESGLMIPCGDSREKWARILVEKPFGSDTATAELLEEKLQSLFDDSQIYRIDHYLGKSILENILAFRFSNSIFEPLWNRDCIESIEVSLCEKIDLEGRGAFFDGVGALRDLGQNHVLQMLAAVLMEKPENATAEAVHHAREQVFLSLIPFTPKTAVGNIVRGQYEGFLSEKNVAPSSQTETYFRIKASTKSPRFKGVPLVLQSGKALAESFAEVRVKFVGEKVGICSPGESECFRQNEIIFRIQPKEEIALRVWVRSVGHAGNIEPKELSFGYACGTAPDAYERVFHAAIAGDRTIFPSGGELVASWKFIESILDSWENIPLVKYPKGTKPDSIGNI